MITSAASRPVEYSEPIESALARIETALVADYPISKRALALLLVQEDAEAETWVVKRDGEAAMRSIGAIVAETHDALGEPAGYRVSLERQQAATTIAEAYVKPRARRAGSLSQFIGRLCMHPVWGLPILLAVLYLGLYQFVGVFGGGTVVGAIEEGLFGQHINPAVTRFVEGIVPFQPIRQLLVGEYGIWTLGVTYAVALILPIVGFFFLVFAVLEDSGYLPRLAMLVDRLFKMIGLNGRAVIPIVLGFGCDTMATIVTRILETRRERIIATFLLSLTIPCSAQLGVILTLLAQRPQALMVWAGIMVGVFLLAGFLAARVTPGRPPAFYMEIPPMRLPSVSNVFAKTAARLQWYFMEVFPLFILASVIIWVGQITHLFDLAIRLVTPVVVWMGLPEQAAVSFLFGFFRRDYGAAGLFSLDEAHVLTGNQMLIASVVLTLFLPCIAQFLIIKKERGLGMALGVAVFTGLFATAVGAGLAWTLAALGVNL